MLSALMTSPSKASAASSASADFPLTVGPAMIRIGRFSVSAIRARARNRQWVRDHHRYFSQQIVIVMRPNR
jgi:hypothetical protein